MEQLHKLYTQTYGFPPAQSQPLPTAGSNRQYHRLTAPDGTTVIGVIGTSADENQAFIHLTRHLTLHQLPVPQILATSPDSLRYLQTDLGNRTLYDALQAGRQAQGQYNSQEQQLLSRTIQLLPDLQIKADRDLDYSHCYPQPQFDQTSALFDLNYFKYCFLKPSGIDFHELRLEEDFRHLAQDIADIPLQVFIHRDFQARNIMLSPEDQPYIIDYQGGRRGPLQYDLASFLWQASAHYPDTLRQQLIDTYLRSLSRYIPVDIPRFHADLSLCVLLRLLQVLGAYGYRGHFERKQHFLQSIPPAIQNLRQHLVRHSLPYPYLQQILTQLVGLPQYQTPPEAPAADQQLHIHIYSFSYRKGIPADTTPNGGGYVFDCRSIHNPGRYQAYKNLTGLDQPVIRFLEDNGEILRYLQHVESLIDSHVERYLQRSFTHLMIAFGCTGGQHRSVYCAQHLAQHLAQHYPVQIHLIHRELGIHQTLPTPQTAFIFTAGLGTRLRPLTDTLPKALVPVAGQPLLQHLLTKLHREHFTQAIINLHHHADQIEAWCQAHPQPVAIRYSDERTQLLDTGGALRHALPLLRDLRQPILLHNVDILSNARLQPLLSAAQDVAALLLVSPRPARRQLLFDQDLRLVGWTDTATGEVRSPHTDLQPQQCRQLAFAGIHVIHPRLLPLLQEQPEKFGIIDFYLQHCASQPIYGYIQDDLRILDVGKPETLRQAQDFLHTIGD